VVGDTVDRDGLLAVASPVVLPAPVVASLDDLPSLDDLAQLVALLRKDHELTLLEAPPQARRVSDESDLRLLEQLA
jgi:2-C-methyl-D-erythritol 4-phosphate cytidylyltransferase